MRQNSDHCRFKFVTIGLIALLMLSACSLTRSIEDLVERLGYTSPEDYILKSYSIGTMSHPVILSQRQLSVGLLYLFTFQSTDRQGKMDKSFAFQLFIRNPRGTGWSDIRGSGYARGDAPPRSPLLDYEISISGSESDNYVVMYGKALDPRVSRARIGYDQGDYLAMIDNGVFGEVVPKQVKLCSLSILSKDDQVLERIDLTKGSPGISPYARPGDCPSK